MLKRVLFVVILISCFTTLFAADHSISEKVLARLTGPFHFRLILQPLLAVITGFAQGRNDAKENAPPYLWNQVFKKTHRKENLRMALNSIWRPLTLGIVIDAIVQYLLFDSIRILGAIIMGLLLIALPI